MNPVAVENVNGDNVDAPAVLAAAHDNDDTSLFRDPADITRVLSQHDPDRMKLTKQEHDHAVAIKEVIDGLPDLDNLSDLMYAQLAMVCKNNIENVIQRCYAMQDFKQEYSLVDTKEQGQRYLEWGVQLFPQHLLSFGFCQDDGKHVIVHDLAKFEPKAFTSPNMADDWCKVLYYLHLLMFPDLESIRKGIVQIVECQGMRNMRTDILNFYNSFYSQYLVHYPMAGQCRCFHTGTMVNILVSLLRRMLPEDLKDDFLVGYQFDGNLGEAFLTPTVKEANARLLVRMEEALKQRYDHEKSFSLGE